MTEHFLRRERERERQVAFSWRYFGFRKHSIHPIPCRPIYMFFFFYPSHGWDNTSLMQWNQRRHSDNSHCNIVYTTTWIHLKHLPAIFPSENFKHNVGKNSLANTLSHSQQKKKCKSSRLGHQGDCVAPGGTWEDSDGRGLEGCRLCNIWERGARMYFSHICIHTYIR